MQRWGMGKPPHLFFRSLLISGPAGACADAASLRCFVPLQLLRVLCRAPEQVAGAAYQ